MTSFALLLIGGIDPTGQAGLARDIVVCARHDVTPCPVPTMLTVQTSSGVEHVEATPPALLRDMLDAAWSEHRPAVAKVGAIADADQAKVIRRTCQERGIRMVVDPVLASSSGHGFAPGKAWRELLSVAQLVTPNQEEADALGLRDGDRVHVTRGGGIPGPHRGTGDRFASHAACGLVLGLSRDEAIIEAHRAMRQDLGVEAERIPDADRTAPDRAAHLAAARRGLATILAQTGFDHLPEVGSNFAYAVAGAKDPRRDVAGLAGRITIAGFDRDVAGRVAWGGPHHTGRIAVVLQAYPGPGERGVGGAVCVLNHRFHDAFLDAARRAGLMAVGFDRVDEPDDAPSSMEWGLLDCIRRNHGRVPDLVWDRGGIGKEAMIRVIGHDPSDVAHKLRLLHDAPSLPDPDGRSVDGRSADPDSG